MRVCDLNSVHTYAVHRALKMYIFSAGFKKFVNVLCEMTGDQRKLFLQFSTGCSSLPPGGLANLNPRLTVVKKVKTSAKNLIFV